jgi:CheY-like chemotaxis protein
MNSTCKTRDERKIRERPVLFADDDDNDRSLFRFATAAAKWANRIIEFSDGEQLIEYLKHSRAKLPALIVVDNRMANIGGFGVLSWLRTQRDLAVVPAVVISNSSQDTDVAAAAALGAAEYRVKPTKYSDLVHLAEDLRQKWLDSTSRREQGEHGFERSGVTLAN